MNLLLLFLNFIFVFAAIFGLLSLLVCYPIDLLLLFVQGKFRFKRQVILVYDLMLLINIFAAAGYLMTFDIMMIGAVCLCCECFTFYLVAFKYDVKKIMMLGILILVMLVISGDFWHLAGH